MAVQQHPPMISAVEDVDCGIASDCKLGLVCNKKRFNVLLSPHPPPGFDKEYNIEGQLLRKLDRAMQSSGPFQMDEVVQEISNLVAITCQPVFRELAPIIVDGPQTKDLHTFLNPRTFELQLVTLKEQAKVIKQQTTSVPKNPRRLGSLIAKSSLPSFYSSKVEVLDELLGARILKVSVNGRPSCCKVVNECTHKSISREFASLQRIFDAKLPSIRVPKPVGFVKSDDDDIIAVLLDYIQPDPTTPSLDLIRVDSVEKSRRQKWASQIRDTITQLHQIGIIWGDGKTGNILIDKDDNAWIIDF
ncbi:hypothetical protein K469DRAFT_688549 [Zopfia rhizophila CBS 207.26]|uniref:non-specific serine/threonine protein kinase n=1 Tax=Zopfia rhizophila CBS 207.26 TaxID=1314779 RepID=A0A6A6E1S8_9PEZI|nr:hypothetical protein K469DRAFT_688549 [Zopfia rhizophila CBS 207.26]